MSNFKLERIAIGLHILQILATGFRDVVVTDDFGNLQTWNWNLYPLHN